MAVEVRALQSDDVDAVQLVEIDAGERFRSFPDPRVAACADNPPYPADELRHLAAAGRAWVAVDDGNLVGFLLAEVVDGCGHVEEVAVGRAHGNRGIATALLDLAATWAGQAGLPALTLTTFRDVPWNRPLYERRGFRVLEATELDEGLRAKVLEEKGYGLPPELRVVMRRELP